MYTQYTIFNMNKKNTLNEPKSAAMGIFPRDSVRNSRGKRAISVRAIEVLLYIQMLCKITSVIQTSGQEWTLLALPVQLKPELGERDCCKPQRPWKVMDRLDWASFLVSKGRIFWNGFLNRGSTRNHGVHIHLT